MLLLVVLLGIVAAGRFRSYKLAVVVLALTAGWVGIIVRRCELTGAPDQPLIECLGMDLVYALLSVCFAGLLAVLKNDSDQARHQAETYAPYWVEAARFLDAWELDGKWLRGTYSGRLVEATASQSYGPVAYGGGRPYYTLSVSAGPGGRRWTLRHTRGWRPWAEPDWELRSSHPPTTACLFRAGAVDALRAASHSISTSSAVITYRPTKGTLTLSTADGRVPTPEDFLIHLDLLTGLVAINTRCKSLRRFR